MLTKWDRQRACCLRHSDASIYIYKIISDEMMASRHQNNREAGGGQQTSSDRTISTWPIGCTLARHSRIFLVIASTMPQHRQQTRIRPTRQAKATRTPPWMRKVRQRETCCAVRSLKRSGIVEQARTSCFHHILPSTVGSAKSSFHSFPSSSSFQTSAYRAAGECLTQVNHIHDAAPNEAQAGETSQSRQKPPKTQKNA